VATAREQLWDAAVDQYGYVTLRDAARLGIDDHTVRKLCARNELDRPAHGVYRFPQLPVTAYDPYMLAVLWTGVAATCLSHDTALAAYEVCDINPERIHLTVPTPRRIRRSGGDLYLIHHQDLTDEQVGWWQQIPTATLPTAMAQCIASGVPGYLLRQALAAGRARGQLSATETCTLERSLEARDDHR
jgi:predicted transcriptional regulator of viral defense system